jgi:hypothetical protein
MAATVPGSAVLAEYRAILADPDYFTFFKEAGNGSFGAALICVLLAIGGGGGGGGGTSAATIAGGIDTAFGGDADTVITELQNVVAGLAALAPPAPLKGNATFTTAGDALEFDVEAAYGSEVWTANFNLTVSGLGGGESVELTLETREQTSAWAPKSNSSDTFTLNADGDYTLAASWSDEQVRLRCITIPATTSINVFGSVKRGGSGV